MATPLAAVGAWSLQSKNTAKQGRYMLGSLLAQADSNGGSTVPMKTWRSGVLVGQSAVTGGSAAPLDLVVGATGSGLQLAIYSGSWIVNRAGQGPYLGWLDANGNMTCDAADGTNPRLDLVVAEVRDSALGDAAADARIRIVNGTPAPSPTLPAVPTGCIPLAQIAIAQNATTITNANVTDLRKGTSLNGGVRVLLGGDNALADPGYRVGELRFRRAAGSLPDMLDYWGEDQQWHGTKGFQLQTSTVNSTGVGGDGVGAVGVNVAAMHIAIPNPGWPYKVRCSGTLLYLIGPTIQVELKFAVGATKDATKFPGRATSILAGGSTVTNLETQVTSLTSPGTFTGAQTAYFVMSKLQGPSGNGFNGSASSTINSFCVDVIPA